jgi:hypothetical protein
MFQEDRIAVLKTKYEGLIAKCESDIETYRAKLAVIEEIISESNQSSLPLREKNYAQTGLTDALRDILATSSSAGISGTSIRKLLLERGVPKTDYFSTNVHTTLKRLIKQGQAKTELRGKERWYFKP